jgi:hypothetical protein
MHSFGTIIPQKLMVNHLKFNLSFSTLFAAILVFYSTNVLSKSLADDGLFSDLDISNVGDTSKADFSLIVGFGSYHYKPLHRRIFNEENPSIGLEAWDLSVVYVRENSWGVPSWYMAYTPDYVFNKYFSIRGVFGLATGYSEDLRIPDKDNPNIEYYPEGGRYGILPLIGAGMIFKPFKNGLSFHVDFLPYVSTFSASYNF